MATSSGGNDIDLTILRSLVRDQLISILLSISQKKDLVIEASLMRPLDHIAGASFLKQHGVDRMFKLEPGRSEIGCERRIYLVRPSITSVKCIADHINFDKADNRKREYMVVFVPRKLQVCEMVLEQEGVYGDVSLDVWEADLFVLDQDLLSFEMPSFFKDFYVNGDQSWLYTIANVIANLQLYFGPISIVFGQGSCAKMVHEMVLDLMEERSKFSTNMEPEFEALVLLDRDIDLVSPLCSQVTYQGLVDDTFGIKSGFVEFGPDVTGKESATKMLLNSNDKVFTEIRDRHISNVFEYLRNKARELQSGYDKRHDIASVSDMKQFVSEDLKGLRDQHKALTIHIGACEQILKAKNKSDFERHMQTEHGLLEVSDTKECVDYIEECINRQLSVSQCMQLLCLLSVTHGGLDAKLYKSLKLQFLQSHGYEHVLTFHNFKKAGLFTDSQKVNSHKNLSKKLNLIPKSSDNLDLKNPSDMSYVFGGAYIPLTCRLIEMVCNKPTSPITEDISRALKGETTFLLKGTSARTAGSTITPPSKRRILVVFLGGCTYSEISALRFLGKQKGVTFVVATTSVVNGSSFLDSLVERV